MTQVNKLMAWFAMHGSITTIQAATELGITQLSARIIDIENMGYIVPRERVSVTNSLGEKKSIMSYSAPIWEGDLHD